MKASNRKMSGFQLSISTGRAMEALFTTTDARYDDAWRPPAQIDPKTYQQAWFNVGTLIRNVINACGLEEGENPNSSKDILPDPKDVGKACAQECELIQSLFSNEGQGVCKPIFYICDHSKFNKGFNQEFFKLREPNTPKQVEWFRLYDKALDYCLSDISYKSYSGGISSLFGTVGTKSLIISHIVPDLLSLKEFQSLELLETHTGVLKPPTEFHTKLHQLKDPNMARLPWNKTILLLFGDKYTVVPTSVKVRKEVLKVCEQAKWTFMTSEHKVVADLKRFGDASIQEVVKALKPGFSLNIKELFHGTN